MKSFSYRLWKHLNKIYGDTYDISSLREELVYFRNNIITTYAENASMHRLSVINYKSGKAPLKVMFLCPDTDIFCLEKLYRMMEESDEFDPVIGIFPYYHKDERIKFDDLKYGKVVQYLEQKNLHLLLHRNNQKTSLHTYSTTP